MGESVRGAPSQDRQAPRRGPAAIEPTLATFSGMTGGSAVESRAATGRTS
jgi:hypothetical protein